MISKYNSIFSERWPKGEAVKQFEVVFVELVGFSASLFSLSNRTKERHNELLVIHKIEYTVPIGLCSMFSSVCKVCRNAALALRQFLRYVSRNSVFCQDVMQQVFESFTGGSFMVTNYYV